MMRKAIKLKNGKIVTKPLKNDGDKLDYLVSAIGDIKIEIKDIKTDMSGMKDDINSLKSDVSGLKTDVSSLKSDVSGLKNDVSILKSDVSEIKSVLKDVKRRGDATFEEVGKIRVEMSEMRDEMGIMNGRLDRLENEKHLKLSIA